MKRHCLRLLLLGLLPQLGCATFLPGTGPAFAPVAQGEGKSPIELPPREAARACLATAQTLEKNGHEPQAIAEYEKARQQDPRMTQVARRLAVLYDRQGDSVRALAEYKLAVETNPRDAELLNDLGYFHYQRGSWTEAEKWLRQATALDPHYARAWVNLGLTLGHEERYQDSFEAFAKVLTPAEAHANVGVLLAQEGRAGEARVALRQALEQEPDLKSARAVLARLDQPQPEPSPRAAAGSPPSRPRLTGIE